MDEILVRPARSGDVEMIARMWTELVAFHSGLDDSLPKASPLGAVQYARRIEDQLQNPYARVLVAEAASGRLLVGYVMGVVVDLLPEMFQQEKSGFLADIFVAAEYRQAGVGRTLVNALSNWFRERGLTYFEWHVAAQNQVGVDFWRAMNGRDVMIRMRGEL
jgi:ribosomal protein S18 acetylase RimI-like enzyme